jgi:hypothetical protein
MLPRIRPSFQISGRFQSGHQRARLGAAPFPPLFRRGANRANRSAVPNTGSAQTTKSNRHELSTAGKTSGMVSATASVSPTRRPLVYTAVAKPMRCGNQARTSGGSAGCMIETPAAITIEEA